MEKIAQRLTRYLIERDIILKEKRCIYQYGFQIGLEVTINTIISICIAIMFNMVVETLVFFFVFILLRSYAGGLHLNSYMKCLIGSCLSLTGLLYVVGNIDLDNVLSEIIVVVSLVMINCLSPVIDSNRPVSDDMLIVFAKKLKTSLFIIFLLSFFLFYFNFDRILLMVSCTTSFMIIVLILGKIKYKLELRKEGATGR